MDSRQAPGLGVKLSLAVAGFAGLMDTAFLLGVIAAYAKYLGADEDLAGFIAGLYSMVAIPASILAGFIVDRMGRRKSLLAGLAWDAASMTAYSYASTPMELALVRGLHALGGSLVYPALFAMIGDIAGRGRRGSYSGSYLAVVGFAVAVGSALGGKVTEAYGFTAAFRLVALILLAGLLASLTIPETARPKPRGAGVAGELVERSAAVGRYILAAAVVIASLPFFILAGRAADRGLRDTDPCGWQPGGSRGLSNPGRGQGARRACSFLPPLGTIPGSLHDCEHVPSRLRPINV